MLRPWGSYESVNVGLGYQVKKIIVSPGHRISLQYHLKRSEHWVITQGQGLIQVGEDLTILTRNQSVYIPKGVIHRITNKGDTPLIFIETQIGDYLGEDDIVRIEDDYQR